MTPVTSRLLQLRLQLRQLHPLRCVGWRQQAGRVKRQALVGHQVGLARQAVLQLQVLQLLGQDGLAAAQVSVGSSAQNQARTWLWSWLWSWFWLRLGVHGRAGRWGVLQVRGGGMRLGQRSSASNHQQMLGVLLSFLLPAARYLLASGSGVAAGQPVDELLQAAELIKECRLADGRAQLQVEATAGQDERRVAVEALQDVAWRERRRRQRPAVVRLSSKSLTRRLESVTPGPCRAESSLGAGGVSTVELRLRTRRKLWTFN